MEKKEKVVSSVLFITNGITLIICMFLNWLPSWAEDVYGKVNGFTLIGIIKELVNQGLSGREGTILISVSILMMVAATGTIALYAYGIVLHILRIMDKNKKEDVLALLPLSAAALAVITCALFYFMIDSEFLASAFGYKTLSILKGTVWVNVVLAAVFSVLFTRKIVAEYVVVLIDNIFFAISDMLGAIVGVLVGKTLGTMAGSALIGVIGGLGAACLIAVACCAIVCKLQGRKFA